MGSGHSSLSQVTLFIVAFFTIKTAIITILNDFKDIDDDFKKGIKTIPIIFKEKTTYVLLALHFAYHAIIYVYELLPVPVFLFSLFIGTITICKIKPKVAQAEFIFQPLLIALNSI